MFRREAPALAEQPVSAPPAPRRERRPAHESRIFTEGRTFAERKATAQATGTDTGRRLVSLGSTEFAQRNQRTGLTEYLDAELFMDLDKPMERFVQIAGVNGMHALHSVEGKEDKTTLIPGRIRARGPSQLTLPAPPDPPARPV